MCKYFVISIMLMFTLIIAGCGSSTNEPTTTAITTTELEQRMKDKPDSIYIDVRELNEFSEGHIEGMINMPLSTLESNYKELPLDKEIVVICRSGARSMQAINILETTGYEKLVNVEGGMLDWKGEIVK